MPHVHILVYQIWVLIWNKLHPLIMYHLINMSEIFIQIRCDEILYPPLLPEQHPNSSVKVALRKLTCVKLWISFSINYLSWIEGVHWMYCTCDWLVDCWHYLKGYAADKDTVCGVWRVSVAQKHTHTHRLHIQTDIHTEHWGYSFKMPETHEIWYVRNYRCCLNPHGKTTICPVSVSFSSRQDILKSG